MKTKKLLSLLLAIVMVISMMATLGMSAWASAAPEYGVGETFTFKICGCQLGENEITGNVKNIQVDTEESTATAAIISAAMDGNDIIVTVTATSTGRLTVSCNHYYTDHWGTDYEEFIIVPMIEIGQTYTHLIEDAVLSEEEVKGSIKDVTCSDTAVIVSKTQVEDGVEVVLKGVKEGKVMLTYQVYSGSYFGWEDDGEYAVKVKTASTSTFLDLETSTTDILEKKELDQNYNLIVEETGYADVTKVKLSWEIKDINATRTDNKVWNTEDLCWDTSTSTTTINQVGSAKFTLENYSSVKVGATASFKATEPFKGTASYDVEGGKVTLDTANGNDTYSKTNVPTKVINATITTAADDFKTLAATTKATKYGTHTVTIAKSLPTSFVFAGFNDGIAENATVNGMNASAFCEYMVDNGMITEASEFDNIQIKYPYYSKLQGKNVIGTRALSLLFDTTHQESATGDTLAGDNDYTMDKSFVVYFNGSFSWDGSAFVKNS